MQLFIPKKGNYTGKNAARVFLLLLFLPKKKTLKINSEKQDKSKKKKPSKSKQASQTKKQKSNVPESMNPEKRFCSLK